METINVIMRNRITTFRCGPEVQAALKVYFRYHAPGYRFAPMYNRFKIEPGTGERVRIWDGWTNLHRYGSVPTGLFLSERERIAQDFTLRVQDLREAPGFHPPEDGEREVREMQRQCEEAMVAASGTGGLIISATGSGKTYITARYLKRLIGTSCFVVDELALLEQARREIAAVLGKKNVGVVGMGEFDPKQATIATIQTLWRHREHDDFLRWFKKLDVLLIDEIHLAVNRSHIDIVRSIKPKCVFGLTATLELQKEHVRMPAIALAGPPIFEYSLEQSTQDGYTTQGIIVAVGFWQAGIPGEDPDVAYVRLAVRNRKRNDCIEAIAREALKLNLTTVILTERRVHLRILSRRLQNLPHRVLSGLCSREERLDAIQEMNKKTLPLILASRIFYKGVDISTIDVIIDATARPGRNAAIQRYGRGVRMAKGKKQLWYIDIADEGQDNPLTESTQLRHAAFRELRVPMKKVSWNGDAKKVFEFALPARR